MGIRAKTSLGKMTGVGVVIRKDGTREEIQVSAKVSKEQLDKLVADGKLREKENKDKS